MNRSRSILMMLVGAALLWSAGGFNPTLVRQRTRPDLVNLDPLKEADPVVAIVTVAFGGFRGILADLLWMRSSRLQQDGRYFELAQLASWITMLEPRMPQVWAYQGWNMSYNISVLHKTAEERWRWVVNGFELLRDDGLRHNPQSAPLYWELGWIFQHKIGMDLDDKHHSYKVYWAREMDALFEGPRPDYDLWLTLPSSEGELLAADPAAGPLLKALRDAEFDPFLPRGDRLPLLDQRLEALGARGATADLLRATVRRWLLAEHYKLDLGMMREAEEKHGPLDWRDAQAHALYWAFRGLRHAKGFDTERLTRMIYTAMQYSFKLGRIEFIPETTEVVFTPNLAIWEKTRAAYREALFGPLKDLEVMKKSYLFILEDALVIFDRHQQDRQADAIFAEIKELFPGVKEDRDSYVLRKIIGEDFNAMTREEALSYVEGFLFESMVMRRVGRNDAADGAERQARLVYARYQKSKSSAPEFAERMAIREPFEFFKERARQRVFNLVPNPNPPPPTPPPPGSP